MSLIPTLENLWFLWNWTVLEKRRSDRNIYKKVWRKANPEKQNPEIKRRHYLRNRSLIIARSKRYAKENPEKRRGYVRGWYQKHKAQAGVNTRRWQAKNPEKLKEIRRRAYKKNLGKNRSRVRAWREKNRDWTRNRYAKVLNFRLSRCLRQRLRGALKGHSRSAHTLELLGCSVQYLQDRLAWQFQPGMPWENYGFRGWHVDHIKPCASFDLSDPAQQRECFNYRNLQPLWAADNLAKKDSE